jgi:DNA-binding MarR family transcriptional regulator
LRRIIRELRLSTREVERKTGISGAQLEVLALLATNPGASLRELADATFTDPSSVSVVVRRLVALKLVSRKTSAGDARRAELRLTAAGRRLVSKRPEPPEARLLGALQGMTTAEVSVLSRGLGAMARAIEAGGEERAAAPVLDESPPQDAAASAGAGVDDHRTLAEFRYQIRRFLCFSEQAARFAGLEPQQHQFLLACKGISPGMRPTIRALAERLFVEHNTAVQMINKLAQRDLVRRVPGLADRREVLIEITPAGEALLADLSWVHRAQLQIAGHSLHAALGAILRDCDDDPQAAAPAAEPVPGG